MTFSNLLRRMLPSSEKAKTQEALRLLADHPEGLYGSEIALLSDWHLTKWNVYLLLGRLVDARLVREVKEPPAPGLTLCRTRHFITVDGRAAALRAK
jgi:hypothetical protein